MLNLNIHNSRNIGLRQTVEQHDFVYPVKKFRPERLIQLSPDNFTNVSLVLTSHLLDDKVADIAAYDDNLGLSLEKI